MKHKKINLVILAGGRGSRLGKITKSTPKPMIKFGKIPFIKYLINYYCKFNFEKIYIIAGYKRYIITRYFKKIPIINSIPIEIIQEKKPLGTGGALSLLKKKKINNFFLVNGDTYFEPSKTQLTKMQNTNKIGAMLFVKNINYKNNKILSNFIFRKNKIIEGKGNLMNSGIYFFKKKIFNMVKKKKSSLENNLIINLIKFKKIDIIFNKKKQFFIDIGTNKNYKFAKKNIFNHLVRPAFFFDRDGVVNELKPYISDMHNFKLRKNLIQTLKFLLKKNYYLFIITNQAGIAKGYFTEKKYLEFEKKIKIFLQKNNVYFHDVKYCPYHPKAIELKYKKNTKYRKPGNLMIGDIKKQWPINFSKSFFIGDQKTDEKAARSINLKFQYVKDDILSQVKKLIKKKSVNNCF
jgi:D-glycero-D-manno-heptose 1,7-bisphosphate phosphatase